MASNASASAWLASAIAPMCDRSCASDAAKSESTSTGSIETAWSVAIFGAPLRAAVRSSLTSQPRSGRTWSANAAPVSIGAPGARRSCASGTSASQEGALISRATSSSTVSQGVHSGRCCLSASIAASVLVMAGSAPAPAARSPSARARTRDARAFSRTAAILHAS